MEKLIVPAIHLFGLVAFIIYKTKGSFVGFMKTRHEEVSVGLNKAKIQAAEVGKKKKEIEAKFAGLEKEKEFIFSEWKAKEEAQIKSIKESSIKIIKQMTEEAEINKRTLEQQTIDQIKRKIGEQILAQAEDKIKSGLNDQSHKLLVDQFIKEVSA
jgi:F0F1-type ATP synthase membrane subunit b/b'